HRLRLPPRSNAQRTGTTPFVRHQYDARGRRGFRAGGQKNAPAKRSMAWKSAYKGSRAKNVRKMAATTDCMPIIATGALIATRIPAANATTPTARIDSSGIEPVTEPIKAPAA